MSNLLGTVIESHGGLGAGAGSTLSRRVEQRRERDRERDGRANPVPDWRGSGLQNRRTQGTRSVA
jgi:hypothetical protein